MMLSQLYVKKDKNNELIIQINILFICDENDDSNAKLTNGLK